MKLDKVNQAYFDIIKAGYLEDRREYDLQLLAASYPDFTSNEVELLERLIQANFTVTPNRDDLVQVLAKELAGDIQMEIDDGDIGRNTETEDWLDTNDIYGMLVRAIDVYRTNP